MNHFKRRALLSGVAAATSARLLFGRANAASCPTRLQVRTGFMELRDNDYRLLKGRKIGLIANPTSTDEHLKHIADILHAAPSVNLAAIFGPEHGFRGTAPAGHAEPKTIDARTGVPVYDIYTLHGEPLENVFRQSGVDLIVFDIQDVGARFYTYIWTLFDSIAACARTDIEIMVLDRPNPISGLRASGPVLDPALSSFVGRAPIALRHGMTVAELAHLFNAAFIPEQAGRPARLQTVAMHGWRRSHYYDQTGLPWVPPSPNMPTLATALAYPGTCLFEGTNLSVGRGTATPFTTLAALDTDHDADGWVTRMAEQSCPGVEFREMWFTPEIDPFAHRLCHGLQIVVTDRDRFEPILCGIALLQTAPGRGNPKFWRDGGRVIDRLAGTTQLRAMIDDHASLTEISAAWEPALAQFNTLRQPHLLYR